MLGSGKVFAITKEAWLVEAPCLEVHHLDGTQNIFSCHSRERERLENHNGLFMSRREMIHGTSAHITLARTSHVALSWVVIPVP